MSTAFKFHSKSTNCSLCSITWTLFSIIQDTWMSREWPLPPRYISQTTPAQLKDPQVKNANTLRELRSNVMLGRIGHCWQSDVAFGKRDRVQNEVIHCGSYRCHLRSEPFLVIIRSGCGIAAKPVNGIYRSKLKIAIHDMLLVECRFGRSTSASHLFIWGVQGLDDARYDC